MVHQYIIALLPKYQVIGKFFQNKTADSLLKKLGDVVVPIVPLSTNGNKKAVGSGAHLPAVGFQVPDYLFGISGQLPLHNLSHYSQA